MTNSPTSPCNSHDLNLHKSDTNKALKQIPVEIISEEEMGIIETAFSLASTASRSLLSPSRFSLIASHLGPNSKPINSSLLVSKRALPTLSGSDPVCDIEDSGGSTSPKKKCKIPISFLSRFRRNKGLYVTDITATEWCEKQMEFVLNFGKPDITNAMKAGITRHAELEEEVIKKVEVRVETSEDIWALKFMNFISCANQLLFDGLTRELPVKYSSRE